MCYVRDCFRADHLGLDTSYAVDAETGERSELCFKRRKSEDRNLTAPTNKAYLYIPTLPEVLHRRTAWNYERANVHHRLLHAGGFAHFSDVLRTEDLSAHVFDGSEAALSRAVTAWERVFLSLAMPFDRDMVVGLLQRQRDTRILKSHSSTVYNLNEVVAALKDHPDLTELLRLE